MAVPGLVQHMLSDAFPGPNDSTLTPTVFTFNLPNPTLSGNCLVLFLTHESPHSVTITDDKSSSWGSPLTGASADDGQIALAAWVLPNCTADIRQITLTYSANTANETVCKFHVSEWYNIATSSPSDATPAANAAATLASVGSGAIAPATDGSLILNCCRDSAGGRGNPRSVASVNGYLTGITAGTNFSLLAADRYHAMAAQYYVQPSHASISPTLTMSGANGDTALSVSIALKAATAGTAPSGARVVGHYSLWCDGTTETNPHREIPTYGNLVVIASDDFTVDPVTSMSDSAGNTYTRTPDVAIDASRTSQIFYADNATASPTNVVTITKPAWQTLFQIFDIAGVKPHPFDTSAATHDDVVAGPDVADGGTLTPTAAGDLIIARATFGDGPPTAVNNGAFMGLVYAAKTDGGPEEGSGLMVYVIAPRSPVSIQWTTDHLSSVATTAVAFKSADAPEHARLNNSGTRPAAFRPGLAR